MLRKSMSTGVILILLSLIPGVLSTARAQGGYDPTVQTQTLLYDEARTVYLGNLARRDNGIPPLRWNRQLTHAARWFSWDSTENRPTGFCGHQDSQGHEADFRASFFGFLGFAGYENAFCNYLSPEAAIQGWMNSPGHRANLLNPNLRETGLGYYRRNSDGRGYVTQDFGSDSDYAPVIIENESISTTNPNVNLYIYDRSSDAGFAGLSAATQMMVSNTAYFQGAAWEPYTANKAWTLATGNGWREVYVKTRDKFNRSLTATDIIYLGANVPLNELGSTQMSTTQSQVTLYNLNGGGFPQAQFSLGWMADDEIFSKLWGNGGRINDAAAWGGTTYRLYPGDGESSAWAYDWTFIKDVPLVAYFRIKVNNNTSSGEVARVSVQGGGTEYGPLVLRGTDFTAPNLYQEFALNFTFNTNPSDDFLIFQFWRSGSADVYVDAVTIFSTPQAITSPLIWSVPGNNYRGQGVWVRYTNGSQFSVLSEAATVQEPYVISGDVGVEGVTLSYTDGTARTATSLADGTYSLQVSNNWSGTVTPSHSCFTFNPTSRTYGNVITNQTNQNYATTLIPASSCAHIEVDIGGIQQGTYGVLQGQSKKVTYNLDNGPVKIESINGVNIVAALRDALLVNGSLSTFSQIMGLPNEQLSDTYWFPTYVNNSTLNGQLRFANVGVADTTVTVTIGGVIRGSYLLHPNEMKKVDYPLDAGPVKVQSSGGVPIVAALRDALVVNGGLSTFSQMMGIPDEQLSDTYWFPAYVNNSTLNGQLRFANVGVADTTVTVTIGGVNRGSYLLHPNEMKKVDYPLDAGPVKVQSSGGVSIVAALRDALLVNGSLSTFSQLMGIPDEGLSDTYWIPAYVNNSVLNGQLRFGNVGVADTTVTVTIGGVNRGSYLLHPNENKKVDYALDAGPVKITSTGSVPIVAALRDALLVNGSLSTFSQLMGLPDEQLSTIYWFPTYVNNSVLNGQLRFGVP